MKHVLLCILVYSQFNLLANSDSTKSQFKDYITIGISYNSFEPYGIDNFHRMSESHWIQPRLSPTVSYGINKTGLWCKRRCDYFNAELGLTLNRSEYSRTDSDPLSSFIPIQDATTIYSYLNGEYGWLLGNRFRIGISTSLVARSSELIFNGDARSLEEFGILDPSQTPSTKMTRLDISVGPSVNFKVIESFFINAKVEYGTISQINLDNLPNVYHPRATLRVGYIFPDF